MTATGYGRLTALALMGSTLLTPAAMAQTPQVGAIGAVNPRTTGQPPTAAAPRQLVIADQIVLNERILSGPDGAAQVMFLDQTTLTVGPNSDVVIDSYLYDPEQAAGEMALSLARGAMRFIGGRITKSDAATVNVAGAVVALRGGIADLRLVEGGAEATFLGGEFMTVTQDQQSVTVSRPGGRVVIGLEGGGLAPGLSYAGVVDAAATATLYQTTRTEGGGGARQLPAPGQGAQALAASLEAGAPDAPPISTSGELPAEDIVEEGVELVTAALGGDISSTLVTNVDAIVDQEVVGSPTINLGLVRVRPTFTVRAIDANLPPDGDLVFGRVVDSAGNEGTDTFVLLDSAGEGPADPPLDNDAPLALGRGFIEVTALDTGSAEDGFATPRIEIGDGLIDGQEAFEVLLRQNQTARLDIDVLDVVDTIVIGAAVIESPLSYFLGVINSVSGPVPVQLTVRDSTGVVRAQQVDLNTFPGFEDFIAAGAASIDIEPQTTIAGAQGDISLSAGFLSGDSSATFDIDENVLSRFNLTVESPMPVDVPIGLAGAETSFALNIEPQGSLFSFAPATVTITDASGATFTDSIDLRQTNTISRQLAEGRAQVRIQPNTTLAGQQGQARFVGGLLSGDPSGLFDIDELETAVFDVDVSPQTLAAATDQVFRLATVATPLSYSLGLTNDFSNPVFGSVFATLEISDVNGARAPVTVDLNPRVFRTDALAFGNASIAITPQQTITGLQGDIQLGEGFVSGVREATYDIDRTVRTVIELDVID